jgi:hypothetical protein
MQESQEETASQEALTLLEGLTLAYQQGTTSKIIVGDLGLLEAMNSTNLEVSAKASIIIHALADRLSKLIVKDSRFPGVSVRMIRGDDGAIGFYPNMVGFSLVRRALQTGSPEAAVEWLQKVLETTTATGKTIRTLWGVPVDQEIELTSRVKIVPIDKLPDSRQKQRITGHSHLLSGPPVMNPLNWQPPQSALVVSRKIEPFIYDPDAQPNFTHDEFIQTHELLLDVTLVLTVVGPRASIPSVQWFTFDDPDLNEASIVSGSSRWQNLEILPAWHTNYPVLDPEEAPLVVKDYLALQGNTRSKVRVALQRLNQAQRRHNIGDRAVELSTAFEALLGDNSTTEMIHKIKVRSVRLIGGTDEVRKRNAAILNNTYKIRSTLVHTGHVDELSVKNVCGQKMSASDIIDQTITMCSNLIKIIIRRGSIPDWSIFDIAAHN